MIIRLDVYEAARIFRMDNPQTIPRIMADIACKRIIRSIDADRNMERVVLRNGFRRIEAGHRREPQKTRLGLGIPEKHDSENKDAGEGQNDEPMMFLHVHISNLRKREVACVLKAA
jgi:hypothetical protein